MVSPRLLALIGCVSAAACSSSTEAVTPLTIADLKNTQWQATLDVWSTDSGSGTVSACSTTFPLTFDGSLFASPDSLYALTPGDAKTSCPGKPDVPWEFRGLNLIIVQSGDSIQLYNFSAYPFAHLGTVSSTKLKGNVTVDYRARGPLVLTR